MANNLRVIFNNVADTATTITSTSTSSGYPLANTKKDTKGLVWRSVAAVTSVTIDLVWATAQTISAVVLPYTNLSATATMRIRLYSNNTFATLIYDSGTAVAVPAVLTNLYTTETSNYRYAFGGGSCARRYIPQQSNCIAMRIDIVDTANTDTYLEISRIISGTYWSPKYNTQFGLSVGINDSSTHTRSQTGNLITDIGTSNKKLTFDLNYMVQSDRDILFNILRTIGIKKSLYVSLFPEDSEPTKEQTYQIYGRLTDLATISNPMYSIYASSINIEEV
jgi:hypothetical protein